MLIISSLRQRLGGFLSGGGLKRISQELTTVRCQLQNHARKGGWTAIVMYLLSRATWFAQPLTTKTGRGQVLCPCCGWRGTRFLPFISESYVTPNTICPQCSSAARHRGQYIFYKKIHLTEQKGTLLYFAPEPAILKHLRSSSSLKIITSDYQKTAPTDVHYDVMNIDVPDGTFDYVICQRVIEHVPDDRKAMSELRRVLKPGGLAIFSVPINPDRTTTKEYGKPNPLDDDHYYEYGTDFPTRIPQGIPVVQKKFSEILSKAEWRYYRITGEDYLFIVKK